MSAESPDRSRMVRILLVAAIVIPICIEIVTFGGLIGHYIGGGSGETGTPTETPTAEIDGAVAGDVILSETPPTERIDRATVITGDDTWQFRMTVTVANVSQPYELRLGNVTTRSGTGVAGHGATTGVIEPGTAESVTGVWLLAPGERPDSLTVLTNETTHSVSLGSIPLSNE
jgi:hypothetical protein